MLYKYRLLASFLTAFLYFASAMANDADDILKKMASALRPGSYYAEMKITTVRPDYSRELKARSWNIDSNLRIIMVTAPARDKGMAYLITGTEIWSYLPRTGRINPVHTTMFTQSWLGSDFMNSDLIGDISYYKENYEITVTGSDMIGDKDCHVIGMAPKPESDIRTGIIKVWVTKDSFRQIKTECFDNEGKITRVISLSYLKKAEGKEFPSLIEIKPAGSGRKTTIEITDMVYDPDIESKVLADQSVSDIVKLLPGHVVKKCFTSAQAEK